MEKIYDPKAIEPKWYRFWLEHGRFHGDAAKQGSAYCVVIPPPNVTGVLHMGHALNITIQDILVRWRRMQGRNTVWMPGTDHAGIATQNVVERALRKEGKSREDLGREAFVERVWAWREEYGGTIVNQLKRLGASCDWDRERFTMDAGLSDAVADVFVRLYDKGLIYRANYIINWCPRCHTALSDEESEHTATQGKLYYLRYPVEGQEGAFVVVATTRPETLLGDVAVAVNPTDNRYKGLMGKTLLLPILHRQLTVIADAFVDPGFGTGAVKVTPAHDPNDFDMGRRHGLNPINVMNGDGTMNAEAGPYQGLDRLECRQRIVADLREAGLIDKIVDHEHAVGHCYRCHTAVEPRLSPQWFVRMQPLAKPAIEAVNSGRIRFTPGRWTKVYLDWMENIRDWCISRQIWWGHRIPIFFCDACGKEWAAKGHPLTCPACGAGGVRQEEDVLDTWFSSWLWPFSTFGWPATSKDLSLYYPTDDLVTASEIIFFWVARMIMAGLEFMGDIPFRHVYIHGTVRDDKGLKMSKSLGNAINPLTTIDEFSADALRFSLMMITATGQDVYVSDDKFEIGRNFGTKLWNAARFMLMSRSPRKEAGETDGEAVPEATDAAVVAPCRPSVPELRAELLSPDDKYLLSRLGDTIAACTDSLERYRFNDAAHALYEFVWHQYCDWYLEYAKDALTGRDEQRRQQVLSVMDYVFSTALRLLHPMMPFVTEELWHAMGYGAADDSIMGAPWPQPVTAAVLEAWGVEPKWVAYVADKYDLIRVGRLLKSDYGIPAKTRTSYIIKPNSPESAEWLAQDRASIGSLLRAETVTVDPDFAAQKAMPSGVSKLGAVYMSLQGVIDAAAETQRLLAQLEKVNADLERANAKLNNIDFVSKAPPQVVDKHRQRSEELLDSSHKLRRLIDTLSNA